MKQIPGFIGNNIVESLNNHQTLLFNICLNWFPNHRDLVNEFSKEFDLRQFDLGDELISYRWLHQFQKTVEDQEDTRGFYIICQGRVRLLSFDLDKQREVATSLLEIGETYGTDELFSDDPLAYRAIAASAGMVAVMPTEKIRQWCDRWPQMSEYLSRVTHARQTLIFFKTSVTHKINHIWQQEATEQSSTVSKISSHTLKEIVPYLEPVKIPQGSEVSQIASSQFGRFWLRSGEVYSQENPALPVPDIGDSWGYPEQVVRNWRAKTDLLVYKLPLKNWEKVKAIAPLLLGTDTEKIPGSPNRSPTPIKIVSNHSSLQVNPQKSSASPNLQTEPSSIAFPIPNKKRRPLWEKRYPFIRQQSSSDCGPTCLAMIAQYWGKRLSINMLRNLSNVGRGGASLKSLSVAAETIGFQARPVKASFNRLADQQHPWIAHWQGDHYVVVYGLKKNLVIISDPAIGQRKLKLTEFQNGWTGYAILLTPTSLFHNIPASKPSLGRFWRAFQPYLSMLWPIITSSLLLQIFGLITPLFTQIILDQIVVHKSANTLHIFIVGSLIFSTWRIILGAIRQYMLDYFSNRIDLSLVSGFITHTLNLPLQFFATRHVGDIITRVQENQRIQAFLTRQAVAAWLDALMAIVYVILMAYYNWQLTLLVLALLPPIILLTILASPFLRQVSREIFNESAKQNSSLVEMLTGVATVKASAAERELRWLWEDHLTSMFNAKFRGQKLAIGLQTLGGLINSFGSTALLWYSSALVMQDQLSIGQLVAFNMLIGNVINPVLSLVGLWDELQEVMVSVERLDDVFNTPAEESPEKPMLVLPEIRGEVQFENVSFRYNTDDDRNILQNISFTAYPGQTIAIVGRSGSGKSTLVSLLQGLYHPTNGKIFIDGHDIRHVSPQSLRRQLGVVPQECFLFSGTILENITLYRREYSLEQVIEVSKLAEAHAFIQTLPLGYNTKVGERGSSLSGGQRQRIAIARAILSNPMILILDEATSSLDTESERRFQQNLARISRDRTTLIIAHRLSTVRNADCILVLDRGVVMEQGNHQELIALQGLYYHLVQQQIDM